VAIQGTEFRDRKGHIKGVNLEKEAKKKKLKRKKKGRNRAFSRTGKRQGEKVCATGAEAGKKGGSSFFPKKLRKS